MSTATVEVLNLGPDANGVLLTPKEFDGADFEQGWWYELVHGVLIVSPSPMRQERDPNEELGHWLRTYRDSHPQGGALDATLTEETIRTPSGGRRRVDRVIGAGLGRLPKKFEAPSIVVEFVSRGKRNLKRDYEEKLEEFFAINVQEYWIVDRFSRTFTVVCPGKRGPRKKVYKSGAVYTTPLLPRFELPLARLFELADRWGGRQRQG